MSSSLVLERTRETLESGVERGLHPGAQVYVSRGDGPGRGAARAERRRGELAIGERAPGQPMTADTLNIWLSSSKPIAAVALARLWERDLVALDDPIARFLPEFAAAGKGGITLRHLLTHTGGFRILNVGWPQASWEEIVARIAAARPEPRWVPGQSAGYHQASSWFILGEVIGRVDGRHFRDYVRQEIFEPLGMTDCWIGMPEERYRAYGDRIGRMWSTEGERPLLRGWHRPEHVVGCSPGGNGYGPMRQLGRFYEMLLDHGRHDGGELLRPPTVEALVTPHRVGMLDRTFKHRLDWGLGFIVDSKHYADDPGASIPYGYGRWASRRTFGHSGFQSSTAFADPEHDLAVAVVANGNPGEPAHTERFRAITEAIYEDLGLAAAA